MTVPDTFVLSARGRETTVGFGARMELHQFMPRHRAAAYGQPHLGLVLLSSLTRSKLAASRSEQPVGLVSPACQLDRLAKSDWSSSSTAPM